MIEYYLTSMILIILGFYAVVIRTNLIKKIIGLGILMDGINLLLITIGYKGVAAPFITGILTRYVDPLPQAMVLTSIVIELSITALALAIAVLVYKNFKTLDTDKIHELRG